MIENEKRKREGDRKWEPGDNLDNHSQEKNENKTSPPNSINIIKSTSTSASASASAWKSTLTSKSILKSS